MGSARFWIPALAVLLNWSLVADMGSPAPRPRPEPRDVSTPIAQQYPVRVSATAAANEFDATLVLAGPLPDGTAPGPDYDCQDTYEWVRDKGAELVHGVRLRVQIEPSSYTQVVFQSASVRVTGTPNIRFQRKRFMFSCGDSRSLPYPGEEGSDSVLVGARQGDGLWALPVLGIPDGSTDIYAAPATWENPYPFDVSATDTASFTIDITIAEYLEPTQFVVDLRMQINGTEQTFVLRDGDRPFMLLPSPGGMGFYPDQYHWCPGSPGRLEFQRGESVIEEFGYC